MVCSLTFNLVEEFFLRKKLMDFINKIQLHLIVKSNQYEMGHLPSILVTFFLRQLSTSLLYIYN